MPLTTQFIKNLQRFRLVTFDITDTLLRFKKSPGIQYAETAASYGYPNLDQEKILQNFRVEFKSMLKKYPNYGKATPNMDWNQWWVQLVVNIFTSINSGIPQDDMLVIAKELVRIYRTESCWLHVDGSNEIVSKVKKSGKMIGVISNFDASLPQILNAMNLNTFDFIITAYDCGILKPNKEIFDLALRKSNATSDQALHIGNLYELDYIGARAAGWSSLLISQMTPEEMRGKDINREHVYQSLSKLLHALEHENIKW